MKKISAFALLLILLSSNSFSQTYDFSLSDVDGNTVTLKSLLEKGPVMIQFWALWCVACKEEMKILGGLYDKYKDSGYVYVALNQDSPKSSAKVKAYSESKNFKFTVLMDPEMKVFEQFGGQNLPFSVFINKKGDIIKTYTGYISGDESKLEEDIKKAIADAKAGK